MNVEAMDVDGISTMFDINPTFEPEGPSSTITAPYRGELTRHQPQARAPQSKECMMESKNSRGDDNPVPVPDGYPVLQELARRAIENKDNEALNAAVTLLASEDRMFLFGAVRHFRGAGDHTAEDALQSAYVMFMERVRSGELDQVPSSVRNYVIDLARNQIVTRKRSDRSARHQEKEGLTKFAQIVEDPNQKGPATILSNNRAAKLTEEALNDLSTRVREVAQLRVDGASYAEIGKQLGIGEAAAQKRGHRSIALLIESIAKDSKTVANQLAASLQQGGRKPKEVMDPAILKKYVYSQLPQDIREVFIPLFYDAVPFDDIADKLGEEEVVARQKKGYEILESEFGVPFPATFVSLNTWIKR